MQDPKNISAAVIGKSVQNGQVRLTVGSALQSEMAQLSTDELLRLLHSLGQTDYVRTTEETHGFPYTFPIVFGY